MALQTGTRVELVHTSDPYTTIKPGSQGIVRLVDAIGTVHVDWDDGRKLGLVEGEDEWKLVDRAALEEAEDLAGDPFPDGQKRGLLVLLAAAPSTGRRSKTWDGPNHVQYAAADALLAKGLAYFPSGSVQLLLTKAGLKIARNLKPAQTASPASPAASSAAASTAASSKSSSAAAAASSTATATEGKPKRSPAPATSRRGRGAARRKP